jgi:hypothetical protein
MTYGWQFKESTRKKAPTKAGALSTKLVNQIPKKSLSRVRQDVHLEHGTGLWQKK